MPSEDFAVVVFANSHQTVTATGNPSHEAELVARNILYALYYGL